MSNLFDNPFDFFALILWGWIAGTVISREARVQLSLRCSGVPGEAQIIKLRRRSGKSFLLYLVTYEFVEFATGLTYCCEQAVTYTHFYQWEVGDTVHTLVLPHNPKISRLTDDRFEIVSSFIVSALASGMLLYSFGITPIILEAIVFCLISFFGNLLWINLRRQ